MDHLTEGTVASLAIRTLYRLARECQALFSAKRTRLVIREMTAAYHVQLHVYRDSMVLLDDSTRLAWLEWDAEARELLDESGINPDMVLQWLDLYPKMVLELYLTSKNRQKAPETATIRETAI